MAKPVTGQRSRALGPWMPWVWLALVSGLALLIVVVWDLQRSVRDRGQLAKEAEGRALAAEAREFERKVLEGDWLQNADPSLRFAVRPGADEAGLEWVIPDELGWIFPQDPRPWGTLVAHGIRQAESAQQSGGWEAARGLWETVLAHSALPQERRSELHVRAAWNAHRAQDTERADRWLAEAMPNPDGEQNGAWFGSWLLLRAERGRELGPEARTIFGLLDAQSAAALGERLAELGVEVSELTRWAAACSERRGRLRELFAEPPTGTPHVRWLDGNALAVLLAGPGKGAIILWPDLMQMVSGVGEDLKLVRATEVAAERSGEQGAVPSAVKHVMGQSVLGNKARLVRSAADDPGWLGAAKGWVLLILGLAGICGGAVWLALRSVRKEAEAAELRGEFLTTVTHELKTPLAGIRLVSELLADDHVQEPTRRRKYLGSLAAESTRLSMLIENVLDLRRMEQGERAQQSGQEDLGELVRGTVELFDPLMEQGGHAIRWGNVEEGLAVNVDKDDLRQAFLNVLDNARKYGARKHGGAGAITITVGSRAGLAIVGVADQGDGIPEEERERIFDRFARGSRHLDGGIPGVGIGLNLARAILRRQGGDLAAKAPPSGVGAYFELSIPLAQAQAQAHSNQTAR